MATNDKGISMHTYEAETSEMKAMPALRTVDYELDALAKTVDALQFIAAELCTALDVVLAPNDKLVAAPLGVEQSADCELAERVAAHRRDVDAVATRLARTRERVRLS